MVFSVELWFYSPFFFLLQILYSPEDALQTESNRQIIQCLQLNLFPGFHTNLVTVQVQSNNKYPIVLFVTLSSFQPIVLIPASIGGLIGSKTMSYG